MLAIVSDLHLQHSGADGIRYRDGGRVFEAGVRRNVSADALGLLFDEIRQAAIRRQSARVELIFAGDIFELHRTPLWFAGADADLRPTDAPGEDGGPLCQKVRRILEAIARENEAFFVELAGAEAAIGAPVEIHYLPGNHDRLANLWPSVRARVRELLHLPPGDARFPHTVDRPAPAGPGVRVRHGHEYDPHNVAARPDGGGPDYDAPALGDYATIDVAARLASAFRVTYAQELRGDSPRARRLRALYSALTEFDDVRPPTRLARYLALALDADEAATFRLLRPILEDVFRNAHRDGFVRKDPTLARYVTGPLGTLAELLLAHSPAGLLAGFTGTLAGLDAPEGPGPAARAGVDLAPGIDVVVAGHTHHPEMVPLVGGGEREAYYVDAGTWRTRIVEGPKQFGRVRACSWVFCFDEAEARRSCDVRRVETWTGNLAADRLGPYHEAVVPSGLAPSTVTFHRLEVVSVNEGAGAGAELRIQIGVDASFSVALDNVRNGAAVALAGHTLPLDPDLDGEVWIRGVERDGFLDPDDVLPWGIDFVPRVAGTRVCIAGARTVALVDHDTDGHRRVALRLHYETS